MSPRKIIFFVIIGIILLIAIYGIWTISQKKERVAQEKVEKISIWVVGDTSEQYQGLFSEFGTAYPQYKDTVLDIRVFPDYEKYQRILLSTLAEGNGPDIFMIEGGGDKILESKITPIPDTVIDISSFDKNYEDIFLPLIITEGTGEETSRSLLGVPLGYETLGVFYHKSLLRSFPKTWSEIDTLAIGDGVTPILPTNLGLGPLYTPGATDIIVYFLGKENKTGRSTSGLGDNIDGLNTYITYGTTPPTQNSVPQDGEDTSNTYSPALSLRDSRDEMDSELLSTVDLFIRGKIAMYIGFPSNIREIEKAEKRAGEEKLDDLILTEKLPQDSLGKNRVNIAKYRYLSLSKKSLIPQAGADLLGYLMSDVGSTKRLEYFPLLLSPLRSGVESQRNTPLSKVFARTRLDAFIPDLQDDIFVFQYDLKPEYEKIFRDNIDRNDKIDINNLKTLLKETISCELESSLSGVVSEKCINNSQN